MTIGFGLARLRSDAAIIATLPRLRRASPAFARQHFVAQLTPDDHRPSSPYSGARAIPARGAGRGNGTSMIAFARPGCAVMTMMRVAQRHRLVDAVRDEQHGLLRLFPDPQQFLLEQTSCSARRAPRTARPSAALRDRWRRRARSRRAVFMPPENWCGYALANFVSPVRAEIVTDDLVDLRARHVAACASPYAALSLDGHPRKDRIALEDHRIDRAGRCARERDRDRARRRAVSRPASHAQQRRLPAAARSDDHEERAPRNLERHLFDGRQGSRPHLPRSCRPPRNGSSVASARSFLSVR